MLGVEIIIRIPKPWRPTRLGWIISQRSSVNTGKSRKQRRNFVRHACTTHSLYVLPLDVHDILCLLKAFPGQNQYALYTLPFPRVGSQLRCQCWMHLLEQSEHRINDQDEVYRFLQNTSFIGMTLLVWEGISEGVALIRASQSLVEVSYLLVVV